MKRPNKLATRQRSEEQEQLAGTEQQTEKQTAREFATPEELLRHDAIHTPVPPAIAERLRKSIEQEPARSARAQPWWRRLLGS